MNKLLIGTGNQHKIGLYREMLGDELSIVTPTDVLSHPVEVDEDMFDIVGNSQLKATMFAKASNLMALSDDSGIFIPALNNEPGVAARRWGGELPGDVSDEDWVEFFLAKTSSLRDDQLAAVKRQVITLAQPNGDHRTLEFVTNGTLLRESAGQYTKGGPFASFFYIDELGKAEVNLIADDKEAHLTDLKKRIIEAVQDLTAA